MGSQRPHGPPGSILPPFDEEVQYSGDGEKAKDRGALDNAEEGGVAGGGDGGGVGGGRRSEYRGGDYYEFIARAPSIRPICVAEGQDLSEKDPPSLAFWWTSTFL